MTLKQAGPDRCEFCGRALRPDEGKGCASCARKIQAHFREAREAWERAGCIASAREA